MRLSFLPKEEKFFDYFRQQGKILQEAAKVLLDLFDHYEDLENHVKRIQDLEHEGDSVVREVGIRLNRIFVTPMDREDIHELSSVLDDVLDYIRAAALRLVLFNVKEPTEAARKMALIIQEAVQEINLALEKLSRFQDVTPHTEKVRALEKEGDKVNRSAIGSLFHNGLAVIEIIKWQEIYERLETSLDRCEDVAQILEGIMLKHA
jgi:predicted phosphate transport protein (TIGR00153 family)